MLTLLEKYKKQVVPALKEKFGYKNDLAAPRVVKVVVNTGFGRLISGKTGDDLKKTQEAILNDLSLITGQRPVLTKAKQSIAGFKLREGAVVGAMVTLRGKKMYDFLQRLIGVGFPRSRDFRGIDPKAVDKSGNLTVAFKEHIVFPEIMPEQIKMIFGFEVTIVTSSKTREEGMELLRLIGFPIKK